MNVDILNQELKNQLKFVSANVSVFFKDLNTNQCIAMNEYELFQTASLMKVVVGIELIRLFESKVLDLNDCIELKNSFISKFDRTSYKLLKNNDGEKTLYSKIGQKVKLVVLLELMIIRSSNLATNNLFDLIEKQGSIHQLLAELGMVQTTIVRGVEDQKAFDAGIINFSTSNDLAKLFQHINQMVVAQNKGYLMFYEIMKKQEHNSIIPRLIPNNPDIAHKTGTLKSTVHDAALIASKEGKKYILILLSQDIIDKPAIELIFAKIAKIFHDFASTKKTEVS